MRIRKTINAKRDNLLCVVLLGNPVLHQISNAFYPVIDENLFNLIVRTKA